MIPNRLIEAVVLAAMISVGSGHLPQILNTVRLAQLKLIQDSKASTWQPALLLRNHAPKTRLTSNAGADK
jgi:hypothetical protein